MAFKRFDPEPLVLPLTAVRDGRPEPVEYTVPPVDIQRGWRLSELLAMSQDELADEGVKNEELFGLAMSDELWQRMRDDGVPLADAWRAGVTALAYFRSLTGLTGPPDAVHAEAMATAQGVWESGLSPEALAAWSAAHLQSKTSTSATKQPSKSGTRKAGSAAVGASTASTSGTRTRRPERAGQQGQAAKAATGSRSRSSSGTTT